MGNDESEGIGMEYSEIYVKRIRKLCKDRGIAINKLAVMSDVIKQSCCFTFTSFLKISNKKMIVQRKIQ